MDGKQSTMMKQPTTYRQILPFRGRRGYVERWHDLLISALEPIRKTALLRRSGCDFNRYKEMIQDSLDLELLEEQQPNLFVITEHGYETLAIIKDLMDRLGNPAY